MFEEVIQDDDVIEEEVPILEEYVDEEVLVDEYGDEVIEEQHATDADARPIDVHDRGIEQIMFDDDDQKEESLEFFEDADDEQEEAREVPSLPPATYDSMPQSQDGIDVETGDAKIESKKQAPENRRRRRGPAFVLCLIACIIIVIIILVVTLPLVLLGKNNKSTKPARNNTSPTHVRKRPKSSAAVPCSGSTNTCFFYTNRHRQVQAPQCHRRWSKCRLHKLLARLLAQIREPVLVPRLHCNKIMRR
jgi:hypothetical protein